MKILGKIAVWTAVSMASAIVGAVAFAGCLLIVETNERKHLSELLKGSAYSVLHF